VRRLVGSEMCIRDRRYTDNVEVPSSNLGGSTKKVLKVIDLYKKMGG
jgi:hypothetical protein